MAKEKRTWVVLCNACMDTVVVDKDVYQVFKCADHK